ncbi:hypothetical protein [Nonlabens antarcticus]|uniref:hypothetical protein n=1 Tax=Nonlabens antarcticus TaxID=392714 RepID=UPI001890FE1A|nr:hypothetical protein [Nonlabens antarcticus]
MILKSDTLVRSDRTFGKVADKEIYQDDFIYKKYLQFAFSKANNDKDSKYRVPIIQWKEDIEIYLDKNLPKGLRKRFESHVNDSYRQIPNLLIDFTRHKNEASIAFINTDKAVYQINPESRKYKYYQKQFPDGLPFDHIKLQQSSNFDGMRNPALVQINYDIINFEDAALKKMKHLFYLILTGFRPSNYGNVGSFTTYGYENQEVIEEMDRDLLKMHYHVIWNKGPTYKDFISLTNPNYE